MLKEVEAALANFLQKGQKSQIKYKQVHTKKNSRRKSRVNLLSLQDPSIIGGMIVSIGDKYVDMSMASKLTKYTEIIKSAA